MIYLLYDSSFEGFLSSVFAVFEYRYTQPTIVAQHRYIPTLFGETQTIYTDEAKAKRVINKIKEISGEETVAILLRAFLSEENAIENHLLEVIRLLLQHPQQMVLENFANVSVAHIRNAAKSVGREAHRLKEFVRFEKIDNLYFAKIAPAFDVLPLVIPHFKNRFSTQQWVIFDTQRSYGFIYDLTQVTLFTPADKHFGKITQNTPDAYQELWKTYFQHINITERKNTRYQLRNMPKRYWQYLPEVN